MSWLSGWSYRKSHIINPASGAGTNYQIKIVAHYGAGTDSGEDVYLNGKCRTDFGDVRFTDDDGITELDYWMEEKVDSDYAIFWVEVADDLSTEAQTIYTYYGNPDATTTSNGDAVFLFWDDFSTPEKWSLYTGASIHDGIFDATLGGSDYCPETTVGTIPNKGVAVEASVKVVNRIGPNAGWDVGIPSNTAGDNDGAVSGDWYLIAFESNGYYKIWEHTGTTYTKIREISYSFPTGVFKRTSARISQNAKIEFYMDETLIDSFIDSTPISSGQGYLAWREGDVEIDWVAVRKFVDPEPSHGAWGSEEGVVVIERFQEEGTDFYETKFGATW